MNKPRVKSGQDGFVLIVAMILMVVMGIFAMNSMRSATVGEKIAGNYRERNQAFMAAEQALAQGQALLRANAVTCLESVCDNTTLVGTAASYAGNTLPVTWSETNASAVGVVNGQSTSGKYLINALTNAAFAKSECAPYSVMGQGVGINANDTVLLQTVVYICSTD
jgi:type IV pilus assembly protein PilX